MKSSTLILTLTILLLSAPVAHAATLTVNSLADPGLPGDGLTTLREAIIAANTDTLTDTGNTASGSDLIDLSALSGAIPLSAPLPDITSSIAIQGPTSKALAISGQEAHGIFLNYATLSLRSLVLRDAYNCGLDARGAIYNNGTLVVENCELRDGRAPVGAGIVNGPDGDCFVSGTLFTGNLATPEILDAREEFDNLRFMNSGAAVLNIGVMNVEDSTFTHNNANDHGILYSIGDLSLVGCSFTENGGHVFPHPNDPDIRGLYMAVATVIRSGSPWSDQPKSERLFISDCNFENNKVSAVESTAADTQVHRSSSISNISNGLALSGEYALVRNCTFYDQKEEYHRSPDSFYGGSPSGFALRHNNGHAHVENCTIVGNVFGIKTENDDLQIDDVKMFLKNSIVYGNGEADFEGKNWGEGNNWFGTYDYMHDEVADADTVGFVELDRVLDPDLATAPNGTRYFPLRPCSPARDAGLPVPADFITDQAGAPRVSGAAVDLGADEVSDPCVATTPGSDATNLPANVAAQPGIIVNSLRDAIIPGDGLVTLREALTAHTNGTTTDLGQSTAGKTVIDLSYLSGVLVVNGPIDAFVRRNLTLKGPADKSLTITTGLANLHQFIRTNDDASVPATLALQADNLNFYKFNSMTGVFKTMVYQRPSTVRLNNCTFKDCFSVSDAFRIIANSCSFENLDGPPFEEFFYPDYVEMNGCSFVNNFTSIVTYSGKFTGCVFAANRVMPLLLMGTPASLVDRCIFSNNVGRLAGALEAWENVTIRNSTFTGNRALGGYDFPFGQKLMGGGAIFINNALGTTRIEHCTIVNNYCGYQGGGIGTNNRGGQVVILRNSIVAGNAARLGYPDVWGAITANNYNVIGDPTGLIGAGPNDRTGYLLEEVVDPVFQSNGGSSRTHAIQPCSPAFDFCNAITGIAIDQRGLPRKMGCKPDAGAFEYEADGCTATNPTGCPGGTAREFDGLYVIDTWDWRTDWQPQCTAEPHEQERYTWELMHEPANRDAYYLVLHFHEYDLNGDGIFQRSEFDAAGLWHSTTRDEQFDLLDLNNDNAISLQEVRRRSWLGQEFHQADMNLDLHLDLTELLRVVQLYSAGSYGCPFDPESTEDGYLAGSTMLTDFDPPFDTPWCPPHSADYNPADYKIDLHELLRTIQFFSTRSCVYGFPFGSEYCQETEDGFCNPDVWETMPPIEYRDVNIDCGYIPPEGQPE